jgi:hypothetical protein
VVLAEGLLGLQLLLRLLPLRRSLLGILLCLLVLLISSGGRLPLVAVVMPWHSFIPAAS